MEQARLAWRGELGAGNQATLYVADWINPYPDKKIVRIEMASPTKPVGANPILLAATGVTLPTTPKSVAPAKPVAKERLAKDLIASESVGKPIDLTQGKALSDREWQTDSGIRVSCSTLPVNKKVHKGYQPYHSSVRSVLYDNNEGFRPTAARTACEVTLPEAQMLSGVKFIGRYRVEYGPRSDFDPAVMNWEVYVSADGEKFERVAMDKLYVPEEQPAVWVTFDDQPIKAVRVVTYRHKDDESNQNGLAFIELYE